MEIPLLIVMSIIFLGIGYLIFLMYQKKKYHWLPSLGLIDVSVILLSIPSFMEDTSGWNDLGYVILAIFLILVAAGIALIIAVFRYFKYGKI